MKLGDGLVRRYYDLLLKKNVACAANNKLGFNTLRTIYLPSQELQRYCLHNCVILHFEIIIATVDTIA
jgi:hypothetical protein